jgi:hypothetical protein
MLKTAASVGWKVKDAIVEFHGIGRLVLLSLESLLSLLNLRPPGRQLCYLPSECCDNNEMAEFYLVTREARETAASEPR